MHEGPPQGAQQRAIPGQAVADLEGETEYPLAHGDVRHDLIDQARGGVCHAAAHAAGAEGAPFARERHQAAVVARGAAQPQEAVRQDAALQEGAQVALHVPRQGVIAAAGLLQEGLQMLGQYLVEQGVLGLVALVRAGEWNGGGVHAAGIANAVPAVAAGGG